MRFLRTKLGFALLAISLMVVGVACGGETATTQPELPINQIVSEEYCTQTGFIYDQIGQEFNCVLIPGNEYILVENDSPIAQLNRTPICGAIICAQIRSAYLEALATKTLHPEASYHDCIPAEDYREMLTMGTFEPRDENALICTENEN